MSPPRIHFAILTYNALDLTRRCFQSIVEHTPLPFAVTVLDNASRDGTQAFLRGLDDPRFTVLESAVNLGVPGGRNVLLQQVLPQLPDDGFVVFLDNDIELQAGWCEPYLELFEHEPRAGVASADGWVIEVRADVRVPVLRPLHTARVDICAGGFACWARKAAALATGPFDEALGLFWHEDDDWSVRMAQAGWQVFVVPEAKMLHRAHASGVGTSLQDPRSLRNQAWLAAKWRAHGWVDQDGFVVARDAPFYLPPARRAQLRQHLGRRTPLCRGEWAQAVWDHEELLRCQQEEVPFRRPVSPLLSTWLEGARSEQPAAVRATGLSRACNSSDYDDPIWLAEHRALFGPEAGPDWYRRDRHQWAATTMVHGLRVLGALRTGATGVDLACLHGAALPAQVAAVMHEAGAAVHTTPMACDFAFGLGGPLVAGTEPRLQAVLDAARRCLRPGGVLAIGVDMAAASRHAPDAASVRAALRKNGFEVCGATDLRAGDDLTSLPLPGLDTGPWPGLVSGRGSEAHTSAVLFARTGALPSLPPVPRTPIAWHCRVDLSGLGSTTALPPWQRHALQLLDSLAESLPRVRFTLHLRRDPPPALWPVLRRENVICDTSTVGSELTFHLVTGTEPVVAHGRRCTFTTSRPVTAEPGLLYLEAGTDLGVPAAPPSPPATAFLTACGVARPYAIVLFSPRELAAVVPVLQAFAMAADAAHLILLGEAAPLLREPVRSLSCGNRVHLLGPIDPESEAALLRAASAGICLTEPDPRTATLAAAGVPVLAAGSAFARRVLGASFRPWSAAALCEALLHEPGLTPAPAPAWSDVSAQVVQAWQRRWPELFGPVLAAVGLTPRV